MIKMAATNQEITAQLKNIDRYKHGLIETAGKGLCKACTQRPPISTEDTLIILERNRDKKDLS